MIFIYGVSCEPKNWGMRGKKGNTDETDWTDEHGFFMEGNADDTDETEEHRFIKNFICDNLFNLCVPCSVFFAALCVFLASFAVKFFSFVIPHNPKFALS